MQKCAPTNIAVLTVTKRLVDLVRDSNEDGNYRQREIVLYGNYQRMKIKDHGDIQGVFLDVRIKILAKCSRQDTRWKHSLESMICLLEEPKEMYSTYLRKKRIQGDGEGGQPFKRKSRTTSLNPQTEQKGQEKLDEGTY